MQWYAFERVFGPITLHERFDAISGVEPGAWDQTAPPPKQTPAQLVAIMRGFQSRGKRKRDQR